LANASAHRRAFLPHPAFTRWPPSVRDRHAEEITIYESVEETFPASDPAAPGGQSEDEAPHPSVFSAAEGADGRVSRPVTVNLDGGATFELDHGAVVISSITSCVQRRTWCCSSGPATCGGHRAAGPGWSSSTSAATP
jgi:hypothetical protein